MFKNVYVVAFERSHFANIRNLIRESLRLGLRPVPVVGQSGDDFLRACPEAIECDFVYVTAENETSKNHLEIVLETCLADSSLPSLILDGQQQASISTLVELSRPFLDSEQPLIPLGESQGSSPQPSWLLTSQGVKKLKSSPSVQIFIEENKCA